MGNLRKKLKTERGISSAPNQSSTNPDTVGNLVDNFQSSSSSGNKGESQLNNSNEKSLLQIFSYLSLDDMIQVKNVCREWREVSQQWFEQVETLVFYGFETFRVELYENYHKRKVYEKIGVHHYADITRILRSIGHHIKYFKATDFVEPADSSNQSGKLIFQSIPKLCRNIVDIDIRVIDPFVPALDYEIMATHWNKLEKIRILDSPRCVANDFSKLLRNNKQLKTLIIEFEEESKHQFSVADKFFTAIPNKIEKITIENMLLEKKDKFRNFISASKRFKSLKSLELTGFNYLTDTVMETIANIKSLEHLSLGYVIECQTRKTIDEIARLKGLKSLDLSRNIQVHQDNVINIVKGCVELESLCIPRVSKMADRGLNAIGKLKNLRRLDIDVGIGTNKAMINLCDKLEILNCWGLKMNNSDAIKMFKKLTNLRYLDLGSGENLTRDIIQAANDIANDRKKNVLYVITNSCCRDVGDIDTPYFKYFGNSRKIRWELIPDDIRDEIRGEVREHFPGL